MWKIYNEAGNKQAPEIMLYDIIASFDDEDYGFISSKTLVNKIQSFKDANMITVRINSAGGEFTEASAIYNALMESNAKIVVKVDGIAASAASLIAMAGDKIIMPENTMMMLHNPWGVCKGEAESMRAQANLLDTIRDMSIKIYKAKTGLSDEKIGEIMNNETYLTAKECKELGFCDEVIERIDVAAQMKKFGGSLMSLNEAEIEKIRNEACLAERERIKELDEMLMPGCEAIIEKAKYTEPREVKDVAVELLKASKTQMQLRTRIEDASMLNGVEPSNERMKQQAFKDTVDAISMNLNRMRGYTSEKQ